MTLKTRELFTSSSQSAFPRLFPKTTVPAQFATGSGTLTEGTLVAWNSSDGLWYVWDGDGSAQYAKVDGVVYGADVALHASGEVMGTVMTAGDMHYTDILAINVTTGGYGTAVELKADLRAVEVRYKNLRTIGLDLTPE